MAQSVKLGNCIRKVLNSNLGLDTDYSPEGCRDFPQSFKSIGGILPLFRTRLFPSKSFTIHVSSYHSVPQNLFTNGTVIAHTKISETRSVSFFRCSRVSLLSWVCSHFLTTDNRNRSSLCWLPASCWFLLWGTLQSWRRKRHSPPKRLLTFNSLHGVISETIELFITTSVRMSVSKF
jgi:hypothetical protein